MPAVSILSYLHYLHDVNRKLIQRGGMENILYRKPASQRPCYHQLDQPDAARSRHWLDALRHIQNAEARGLALRPLVGRSYSEAHLERVEILRRAGWEIVHVPYYRWWRNAWLCDQNDPQFQRTISDLFSELKTCLGLP